MPTKHPIIDTSMLSVLWETEVVQTPCPKVLRSKQMSVTNSTSQPGSNEDRLHATTITF